MTGNCLVKMVALLLAVQQQND